MMTVPLDLEFYFKKALPVIHNYCTQNPLVIDRQKVATLGMLLEKPRISHIQLAWLQAVTELVVHQICCSYISTKFKTIDKKTYYSIMHQR